MGNGPAKDSINILIMSESGKPIFARRGSPEEVARVCGLIRALKVSAQSQIGNIQTISSRKSCICFMDVKSLTLTVIADTSTQEQAEAHMKLILEHCYSCIVSSLTDNVLTDPQYDLGALLDEKSLHQMLDDWDSNPALFFSSAAPMVVMSPHLRQLASQVLQQNATKQTVYSLIMVKDKLLTLVQPGVREYIMHGSDLQLLSRTVAHRNEEELWFPICLPRLFSSGTFHCYTNLIEKQTGTSLVMVTQECSAAEFVRLRGVAEKVKRALGILARRAVTEQPQDNRSNDTVDNSEEDFVDVASNGEERSAMISSKEGGDEATAPFLVGLLGSKDLHETKRKEYTELVDATHFLFRYDAKVGPDGKLGRVSQSFGTLETGQTDVDELVWFQYHQFSLRLRLGSTTEESTQDAFDVIATDMRPSGSQAPHGIASICPAMVLAEATPSIDMVSYASLRGMTMVALNGRDFELYVATRKTAFLNLR